MEQTERRERSIGELLGRVGLTGAANARSERRARTSYRQEPGVTSARARQCTWHSPTLPGRSGGMPGAGGARREATAAPQAAWLRLRATMRQGIA